MNKTWKERHEERQKEARVQEENDKRERIQAITRLLSNLQACLVVLEKYDGGITPSLEHLGERLIHVLLTFAFSEDSRHRCYEREVGLAAQSLARLITIMKYGIGTSTPQHRREALAWCRTLQSLVAK